MSFLRAIFRIGFGQPDDDAAPKPVYPPEDKLTFGFEEVFVTLALLIISYMVLATPCFSVVPRGYSRLGGMTRLNAGGWMEAMKQLRHVRNMDDVKQWWQRLRHSTTRGNTNIDRTKFDPQRWDQLMLSQHLNDSFEMDKTVRTKGGGGRSAPATPLRSFFRPINNAFRQQKIHASTSDGHLVDSPTKAGQSPLYEDDFRPETDHDRFEKAWMSHIRFAEYRRLVLPPECKLVEFNTTWREAEQSLLENLLDESRWNKVISYVRNVLDVLHGISTRLWSKDSIKQFSVWMMNIFRYRMRKQRGLVVEDDDETEDDDDDGSVATLASSVGKMRPMKAPIKSNLADNTPVISNRKNLSVSDRVLGKGPPLDAVPQFLSPAAMRKTANSNHPIDASKIRSPHENGHGDENNDSPVRTGSQSANSEKSAFLRFNTPDLNDDVTFVSASGLEHTDNSSRSIDIPSSVEHMPKKSLNVSPLPMKHFARLKKRDALEKYREPDNITPISLPSLKSSVPRPERISPMPSPKLKPQNPDTSMVDSANLAFFDSANSDRQLRDMSRAVPIPDANGYILGDEFLGSSYTPLLVFVNSRSGPQQGNLLITQFRRLLNPIQVWDLANGGPEKVLKSFSVLSRFQVLVCGGDGTVSWIISALEKMGLKRWPPIGILPLGTGNDLARIHGWGGGYNNESLLYILRQISEAYISMLDLWELGITSTTKKGRQRKESKSFLNYLGVGVDAQAALQVHNLRESKPKLFFSRFFNKAWYAIAGGEEAIKSSCANLSQRITLVADGIEIPLPPDSQGIIFLNIDSYSGGVPLWSKGLKPRKIRVRRHSEGDFLNPNGSGLSRNDSIEDLAELEASRELTACDLPSSCADGLLDVVSIRGTFHLGQIRVGLSNAQLLCQCREASVTLKKKVAVQIDGEPWRQNPSTLRIRRKPDKANMLNRAAQDSGGVETEVTKLLNWANEREVIDQKQYALLMEEFSRRKHRKKRGNGFPFVG